MTWNHSKHNKQFKARIEPLRSDKVMPCGPAFRHCVFMSVCVVLILSTRFSPVATMGEYIRKYFLLTNGVTHFVLQEQDVEVMIEQINSDKWHSANRCILLGKLAFL